MTKFVVTYTCTCTLYICAIAEQVFTVEEAIEKIGQSWNSLNATLARPFGVHVQVKVIEMERDLIDFHNVDGVEIKTCTFHFHSVDCNGWRKKAARFTIWWKWAWR